MSALISFKITDRPDLQYRPFAVDGREALSCLYQFDIECFGDPAQRPDTLDLIGKRAVLRFELEGAAPREVFGIIKTISSGAPSIYGDARYRFQLVPWLERLNYSRASQIHGSNREVSVVDVLEAELQGGLRRETRVTDPDFRIFEHELRLKNRDNYPKRDHVVQYEETDFAFISRLAEHFGIYYFFENDLSAEKIVFADDNLFTKPIEGDATLAWKPWTAGARTGSPDTIQEFDEFARMVPRRMWTMDYNYRLPHVPLLARAEIDRRGIGNWAEYGSHHRTPAEGEALARIRAEEMRSNQHRWTGQSAVTRLSPGRSFKLQDHPYADWNQEYLVVSVHHEVRVPLAGVPIDDDWTGYRNSFEVIQLATPFRPARVTPVPRMDGLLNARIDGAGQRDRAELDDQGRYRVRVPFDNSDTPDGKGSQWVRMASPFGGDGDGMHFPLAPDTEVVVACVNGDPNRPVILGAVPNPRTKSVVTRENARQNVIATRTGMSVVMGADGSSRIIPDEAGGGPKPEGAVAAPSAYGPRPDMATPDAFGPGAAAAALATPSAMQSSSESGDNLNYLRLNVSNSAKHNIRMGMAPSGTSDQEALDLKDQSVEGYASSTSDSTSPAKKDYSERFKNEGIFIYTDGSILNKSAGPVGMESTGGAILIKAGPDSEIDLNAPGEIRLYAQKNLYLYTDATLNIVAQSDINITSKSKISQTAPSIESTATNGPETRKVFGEQLEFTTENSYEYTMADSYSVTIGRDHSITVAGTVSISVSGDISFGLGTTFELSIGMSIGMSLTNEFTYTAGASFELKGSGLTLSTMNLSAATLTARAEATALESKTAAVNAFLTEIGQQALKADGTGTDVQLAALKLIT